MRTNKSFYRPTFIILLFITFLLVACENEQGAGELNDPNDEPDIEEPVNENGESDVDNNDDWADGTLVWHVNENILPVANVDQEIYTEFNRLLEEKGADYSVEFIGADAIMDREGYHQKIVNMKENDQQLDLLTTGTGGIILTEDSAYNFYATVEAVKQDLLEPLDDYLQTKQGEQLYQKINENLWERHRINDSIYGLSISVNPYSAQAMIINEEVAEDLNIEVPENLESLEQLEKLIKQVSDQTEDIIPFSNLGYVRSLVGYSYFNSGIAIDYDSDGVPYAFNPFEDSDVISLMDTLNAFREKEYWIESQETSEEVNNGNFFSLLTAIDPLNYRDGILHLEGNPVRARAYEINQEFIEPLLSGTTGIASWSNQKDEAFDLLTRIQTDPDLANLLYYGIEGEHYELVDGIASPLEHEKRVPGYLSPANQMIIHREGNQPENKEKLLNDWIASGELAPHVGFQLDSTGFEDELEEITIIYLENFDLWMVQDPELNERLESTNQALHDAGIEQVLEEINAQLQSWWKENDR